MNTQQDFKIGLWGIAGSGKTTFLASLLFWLERSDLADLGIKVDKKSLTMTAAYKDYNIPLCKGNAPRQSDKPYFTEFSLEKDGQRIHVTVLDYPGSKYTQAELPAPVREYLANANAIFLVFDRMHTIDSNELSALDGLFDVLNPSPLRSLKPTLYYCLTKADSRFDELNQGAGSIALFNTYIRPHLSVYLGDLPRDRKPSESNTFSVVSCTANDRTRPSVMSIPTTGLMSFYPALVPFKAALKHLFGEKPAEVVQAEPEIVQPSQSVSQPERQPEKQPDKPNIRATAEMSAPAPAPTPTVTATPAPSPFVENAIEDTPAPPPQRPIKRLPSKQNSEPPKKVPPFIY